MEQSELFQTAVQKAKAGERDQAQEMLLKLVEKEPNHELAWLWLSQLVADPEDKIIALENALTINPQRRQTQTRLHQLRQKYTAANQLPNQQFSTNGASHIHSFTSEEARFTEISQLFAAGDIAGGRQQLASFLRRYSDHEAGWWLMVQHADSQTNLLIGLDHLLRLNSTHPEAPKMLGGIKPTREEFLQMGRLYERLERWETAVTYYKRALKSPSNADRLLAQKRLPLVQEQLKLAKIKFTSPTATVLRLAAGPTILYAMLVLIQAGLKPTQASPMLCLGNLAFLGGMLLFSGLTYAPEHPWLQQLRESAVFPNNTFLRLISLMLILLPILLLILLAVTRLLNFQLDLTSP